MVIWQWAGLTLVYGLTLSVIMLLLCRDFKRRGFSFHSFFSLLYLLTFFSGVPLSMLLVFYFHHQTVESCYLLQALLASGGFYLLYYLSYACARKTCTSKLPCNFLNNIEFRLFFSLLSLLAVGSLLIFFIRNGLLLFKLHSYSQIFSAQVGFIPLKRFFYFFIPAMLLLFFVRPTRSNWFKFLAWTLTFGIITYMIVGGTRANILIAFTLFLFIGLTHGFIRLSLLIAAGFASVLVMFWLALQRYNLDISGRETFYTFLYLTRDTFSPWENLALLLSHYSQIDFQGIAPIWRDFYVYIPHWLWPDKPSAILNSANYYTWQVLNNHSGLAISPTLIGSLLVMGGGWALLPGALITGVIIRIFDGIYQGSFRAGSIYVDAVMKSFCFGAIFNLIVLAREGLDAFGSRISFFTFIFLLLLGLAKLLAFLLKKLGWVTSCGLYSAARDDKEF